MKKIFFACLIAIMAISGLALSGCKPKPQETAVSGEQIGTLESEITPVTAETTKEEPGVVEAIPPTAAPAVSSQPKAPGSKDEARDKDIQTALKKAGFYTGAIDGKVGPKTKKAIEEFQKAKGLKVDGKVGPKTWAELQKYLVEGKGD